MLQGIDINWEISGRLSVPEAKVYVPPVPVYMFHKNDLEVHGNFNTIFKKLNWDQWAAEGRYKRMLHQILYGTLLILYQQLGIPEASNTKAQSRS